MSGISLRDELDMFQRGDHNEIMAHIAKFPLYNESEVALIKRGNHEEIMKYVSTYYMCRTARNALLRRGNQEEISAMLETEDRYNHIDGQREGYQLFSAP